MKPVLSLRPYLLVLVCAALLIAALWVACVDADTSTASDPIAASTFHAGALIVDNTSQLGSASTGVAVVVQSANTIAAPTPLQFTPGGLQNSWDISPLPAVNNGDSRITLFGAVPTTQPNTNYDGIQFWLRAGTNGEQGIILRPNGMSFFDPDGWAQKARILALGHPTPEYEFDVRDPGNTHVADTDCKNDGIANSCRLISAFGSAIVNTGTTTPAAYEGIHSTIVATRGTGTQPLTNYALRLKSEGGQKNWSIYQETGDNGFCTAGAACQSTFFGSSNNVVFEGTLSTNQGGTRFGSLGGVPYSAAFGNTLDDATYIANGAINYGYAANQNDHLVINIAGYLNGFTRARDLFLGDGTNHWFMKWFAGLHDVTLYNFNGVEATTVKSWPVAAGNLSTGTPDSGSNIANGTIRTIGATSVTLTFPVGGFNNFSACVASPAGATPQFITVTNSKTAPVFSCFAPTTGAAQNCVDFTYWCPGR